MYSRKISDTLYELVYNDIPYQISFSLIEETEIKITMKNINPCRLPSSTYTSSFTLDDLINKSKYFRMCGNISNAMTHLSAMLRFNRFEITECEDKLYFKLKITCAVPHRITFELDKVEVSKDEVFNEVCQSIKNVVLDFKVLDNDMDALNERLLGLCKKVDIVV